MSGISVFNSLTKNKDYFHVDGNIIRWYTCGPTVYDSSHLGHARTFLTFDIVRRIFEHFGYQVFYVMNITDIDDKIIDKVSKLPGLTKENYEQMFKQFVSDMEREFWDDMDSLGIQRPMVVTRVTEYIDKMIKYIEDLEDNGFAYHSNGSVYFDVDEYVKRGFDKEPLRHVIADDSDGNPNSSNNFKDDKKKPYDFALWKKSKPGELTFNSRWGPGRVGWHLECSVMATDILGKNIDIHSGGIDLVYPHHQCEIMQATAYENNNGYEWIKYFLHSGHLNIDGEKMSKSLKNFTTIKFYLENVGTSQELRVLFLMHKWDKPLDYSQGTIDEAKWVNKRLQDLVDHLEFTLKEDKPETPYEELDHQFFVLIDKLKRHIDRCLKDNFDTPSAMKAVLDGIPGVYKYLERNRNVSFIRLYYDAIIKITGIFGLEYAKRRTDAVDSSKFIELGINLREDVRKVVMDNKGKIDKQVLGELFKVLDEFRDKKLPEAGVNVQDRSGDTTKYVVSSQ